jgi:hypothetical protein
VLIELPIRDVMPGLIRPLELAPGSFFELDADGVRVSVELPIRNPGSPGLVRRLGLVALRLGLSPRRVFPGWPPAFVPSLPGLELGGVGLPAVAEPEEGGRTPIEAGAREVAGRPEVVLPLLGGGVNVLDRDDTDGLEATVPPGLLRLDRFGLLGGRTDGELTLPLGGRLTFAGAPALGAGAGAGAAACRPAEPPLPEFELFRSVFAAVTGSAASAKIKMQNVKIGKTLLQRGNSAILIFDIRVLILFAVTAVLILGEYFRANMIYLLSSTATGAALAPRRRAMIPKASALSTKGCNCRSGNEISEAKPDFSDNLIVHKNNLKGGKMA